MGLESDRPVIYQTAQADRHSAVVQDLLALGRAYPCYCTPEELEAMREKAKAEGLPVPTMALGGIERLLMPLLG